jgi:ABC-2 type transport system permease protein
MTSLTGTGTLITLGLRRDRIILTIWIYAFLAIAFSTPYSYRQLYPTPTAIAQAGNVIANNPAAIALVGPPLDLTTLGGLSTWKIAGFAALAAGLMSILTVIRHTRAEEEAGRQELLGAGVLGRHAPLTAAITIALGANLVIAAVAAIGFIAGGLPATGSITFGIAIAATGWVFTALAACTAQLTENARTANSIATATLAATYLLRAIGDATGPTGPHWLSWLSPIGWSAKIQPFGTQHWWILALPIATTAILTATGYTLAAHRDLGAGLFPARPGPAHAATSLRTPLALAARLHRGLLTGWTIGFAISGLATGGIATSLRGFVTGSPQVTKLLAEWGGNNGITNAFLATVIDIFGLAAAIYTVQAVLRLRSEETAQRVEPILATRTSRNQLAASHLTFALLGTVLILAVAGITTAIGYGIGAHNLSTEIPQLLTAALIQTPATWVLAGIAILIIGALPRYTQASWGAVVIALLISELGPVLQLGHWAMDISPFTHLPKLPGGTITTTPIIWLFAIAIALTAAGLTTYRRRDIG